MSKYLGKHGILLGESGYQLTHYTLIPFLFPVKKAQEDFNKSHRWMRSRVEQTFGIVKNRYKQQPNT